MNLTELPTTTQTSPVSQDGGTTAATVSQSSKPTTAGCTVACDKPSSTALASVTLPWPPKGLSPNARLHHMALANLKREYRSACGWQAKAQGARRLQGVERLHLAITFVPPDRRHRDLDNMLSSIKAGLDGLRDVLGVDDSRWRLTIDVAETIGGMVKVEVTPWP